MGGRGPAPEGGEGPWCLSEGPLWVGFLLGPLFSLEDRSPRAPAPTAPSPGPAAGGVQTNRPLSPDTEPFHAGARLLRAPTAGLAAGGCGGAQWASNPALPAPGMGLVWRTRIWGGRELHADAHTMYPLHARFSALHHAALGGSLELIALLLEAQATVDIKDSNGEMPGRPQPRPCGGLAGALPL